MADWLQQSFSIFLESFRFRPRPASTADEQAFAAQCEVKLEHTARSLAGFIFLATLAWWPLDLWIYGRIPNTSRPAEWWRLIVCAACVAVLLAARTELFRRRLVTLTCILLAVSMAALGRTGGELGGLEKPWFYLSYPVMTIAMLFPLTMPRRLFLMTLQALGWLLGLFLFHPENLASPYLRMAVSVLFLVSVYALLLGQYLFLLTRDNFLQSLALSRTAVELEGKVAERTRELRGLLSYVERAREEERAQISRDLHDELGQQLTALRYCLAFTMERFQREPPTIGKNLAELDRLLQQTTATTRGVVSYLRPPVLDNLGLKAATVWIARQTAERTGMDCEVTTTGEDRELDPELVSAAFRILQESLTNVVRHAKATRVEVSLTIDAARIRLRVRDDGVGFLPAQPASGMGLLGMRERARAFGTELGITSQPGAGTEVVCCLNLDSVPAAGRDTGAPVVLHF